MLVLGLDLETSGLDIENDFILELGMVLWDTDRKTPLILQDIFLYDGNYPCITSGITNLTGITEEDLTMYGIPPSEAIKAFEKIMSNHQPNYIVSHNGLVFDKPFLSRVISHIPDCACGHHIETPWIDTRYDLPFEKEPESKKLNYMAADHGFLNPFRHRAVFDVLTTLVIMSKYDFDKIEEICKTPLITIRALVTFDQKNLAREKGYLWDPDKKMWHKKIRKSQLQREQAESSFGVAQVGLELS